MGVLDTKEIRGDGNETGLKEEGGIEIEIYQCLPLRDARSLSLFVFTYHFLIVQLIQPQHFEFQFHSQF